ncbi:hypothetical protein FB565_006194 [Actinoplanes lutulentus]|uniref:Uncharacterized protein n=1 Tax=Actinoplanes lutulentus TaxID=1287878 RepID=A0A327YWN5_9ACTN|nr:hypothetical protein [Actinoplanes lutulentus]MBB2946426.1 hypothetical protein [Actinoplanes lutulentus]RAK25403.1 hypothetical protein B0I29_13413 [Actinoplanes lutulentus]
MSAPIIAGIAAFVVAILSAVASYLSNQRLQRRQERLHRINRQLSELYGPLLALSEAGRRSYREYLKKHRVGSFTNPDLPASAEALALWQLWMSKVLQPINDKIFDLIVGHADLLIGDEMPDFFLEFCAHKAGFDVTIAQWEAGDRSRHFSVIAHPGERMNEYIRESFAYLKAAQANLIRSIDAPGAPAKPFRLTRGGR